MAHCLKCGRLVGRHDNFCRYCGWNLDNGLAPLNDPIVPPPRRYGRVSGYWSACPKCRGSILIDDPECRGTGRILGPWHEEEHKRCHGTGKVKCDYPGCRNGRIWVNG